MLGLNSGSLILNITVDKASLFSNDRYMSDITKLKTV